MEPAALILILLLVYEMSCVTGNKPVPVRGHVEGSVVLPYSLSVPVREVTWDFPCNGHRVKVAEFTNQKFSITREEFRSRMDYSDEGTSLMIRNLTMNDSGIYTALIYDTERRRHEISYNLTVFEPVPTPDIKMEVEQISPDWCNFTLHCSAPTNPSALSYSWMYRHKGRYQPYPNGTTIRVSLQPESWDGEYLCLVQNPADQKNVSIALQEVCNGNLTTKVRNDNFRKRYLLLIILPLALLLLFLAWYIRAIKKRKKGPPSTASQLDEVQYIEVHTCQSDRGLQTIYCLEQKPASPREARTQTIYTELENIHRTPQE